MVEETNLQESHEPLISIGVLAQKVGLSVSAVRKYENEALVIAHRADSGHRLFSQEDIGRVRNIQHMLQDLGLNIAGIQRMLALVPCWDLLPCSAKKRDKCPAYKHKTQPCWAIKGLECPSQGNVCRECVVYRFGSLCTEEIKQLVYDQAGAQDASEAIKELLTRRRRSREEN